MTLRVPTDYAVTREQKRYIARLNMEKAGKKKFCKSYRYVIKTPSGKSMNMREPSEFAKHWREYAEVAE